MKAIEVTSFGGPEVLHLVDKPRPRPAAGEILIAVKAIGVNPVETYIRAGTYPRLPELPYIPGGNAAGIVAEIGTGLSGWELGQRVYTSATLSGAYAEMTLCSAEQLFPLPERLSFAQGAALGVPAATAWRALFIRGLAQPQERLLVHGASGAVGQAAVQLAVGHGMKVFGTAGSEKGVSLVGRLGAQPYNHRQQGYSDALMAATGGVGFDLILEMLANRNLATDLDLLAPRGRVVVIGSRGAIEIDPRATMGKETDIRGLAVFNATSEETVRTHMGLAKAISAGVLDPLISREMTLAEAAHAHEQVLADGNCGKIVLRP